MPKRCIAAGNKLGAWMAVRFSCCLERSILQRDYTANIRFKMSLKQMLSVVHTGPEIVDSCVVHCKMPVYRSPEIASSRRPNPCNELNLVDKSDVIIHPLRVS
jgi:hypothetical protein